MQVDVPSPYWSAWMIWQVPSLVSTCSVFFVAVDQVITFKFDPFARRNPHTKFTRIFMCFVTWVIMSGVYIFGLLLDLVCFVRVVMCDMFIIVTGLCYILAYMHIAQTPLGIAESQLQVRRERTKRVLKNYSLILLTNMLFILVPDIAFLVHLVHLSPYNNCFFSSWLLVQTFNPLANACIYWWRIREFRNMYTRMLRLPSP
nr:uncharacterized protein LOC129274403 [Lytechinus pictus]